MREIVPAMARSWIAVVFMLALVGVSAPRAEACTIDNTLGSGSYTTPYTRGGTFVKGNGTLLFTNTNTGTANSCKGVHHVDIPRTGNFIIWAAATPNGLTGVFSGNSATGRWAHTYQYDVGCGPCPPGTTIDMKVEGDAKYVQYAGAAGLARVLGSASSTVTGSVRVDPFPGSPFTIGGTPATVTASAGFGTTSAGSTGQQSSPFSSNTTKPCPLEDQTIRFEMTVTASRTGGATSSTASFDDVDMDLEVKCDCGANALQVDTSQGESTTDGSTQTVPDPILNFLLELLRKWILFAPEALLDDGDSMKLIQALPKPDELDQWFELGPRTELMTFDGQDFAKVGDHPFGLAGVVVRGNAQGGAFSAQHLIVAEFSDWDPAIVNLTTEIDHLVIVDAAGFGSQLLLSEPLEGPAAMVFGDGGPVFGKDLVVALSDRGQLALVDSDGKVDRLRLHRDLGTPVDLAWGPAGSSFAGQLLVLDIGSASDDGIRQMGTGRVLAVDSRSGKVSEILAGLDMPTAIDFADSSFYLGQGGETQLLVLSGGQVDTVTGVAKPSTGHLAAYGADGEAALLIEQLNVPADLEFDRQGRLYIATESSLLQIGGAKQAAGAADDSEVPTAR